MLCLCLLIEIFISFRVAENTSIFEVIFYKYSLVCFLALFPCLEILKDCNCICSIGLTCAGLWAILPVFVLVVTPHLLLSLKLMIVILSPSVKMLKCLSSCSPLSVRAFIVPNGRALFVVCLVLLNKYKFVSYCHLKKLAWPFYLINLYLCLKFEEFWKYLHFLYILLLFVIDSLLGIGL